MPNLSWSIGDARITRIVETQAELPAEGLLPEATPEAMAPHLDWLKPHFVDDQGQMRLSIHALVIESQGLKILVDTCVGEKQMPGFEILSLENNTFLSDLAEAGFARESIDLVLCTHMHFDHVGWNTMRDGDRWVPTFPNARYLFARAEWEHWRSEDGNEFAMTIDSAVRPVIDADLADLVETDHRLTDDVWLEATPGHTPGHVSVRVSSGGEHALITGDMTHHPVQWAEPRWKMNADTDSDQATQTRLRLIKEHADTPMLIIGTHYAAPCAGRLVHEGSSCRFEVD